MSLNLYYSLSLMILTKCTHFGAESITATWHILCFVIVIAPRKRPSRRRKGEAHDATMADDALLGHEQPDDGNAGRQSR